MPLYEIEHVYPITPEQQQSIADALVKIHSEVLMTLGLFVQMQFKDTNAFGLFVAGQLVCNIPSPKDPAPSHPSLVQAPYYDLPFQNNKSTF